jgi:hypothetical protein
MAQPPARWSTAANMAWWKKLLIVLAIIAVYLLVIALTQTDKVCGGPMSARC